MEDGDCRQTCWYNEMCHVQYIVKATITDKEVHVLTIRMLSKSQSFVVCTGKYFTIMAEGIMLTGPYNVNHLTPNLYIINRGIYNFLVFALKRRLWVLVRTASISGRF